MSGEHCTDGRGMDMMRIEPAEQSGYMCICKLVVVMIGHSKKNQFNSIFQTHLRSISHNYMSQHNRKMQKQHYK